MVELLTDSHHVVNVRVIFCTIVPPIPGLSLCFVSIYTATHSGTGWSVKIRMQSTPIRSDASTRPTTSPATQLASKRKRSIRRAYQKVGISRGSCINFIAKHRRPPDHTQPRLVIKEAVMQYVRMRLTTYIWWGAMHEVDVLPESDQAEKHQSWTCFYQIVTFFVSLLVLG